MTTSTAAGATAMEPRDPYAVPGALTPPGCGPHPPPARHREVLRVEPRAARLHAGGLSTRDDLPDRPVRARARAPCCAAPTSSRSRRRERSRSRASGVEADPHPQPEPLAQRADPADPPPGADGLPGVQPLPAHEGYRQPDRGTHPREGRAARPGDRDGREVPDQGRPVGQARRVPGPPLGRSEAASRDRASADDGAQGPALRRADLGARSRRWSARSCTSWPTSPTRARP